MIARPGDAHPNFPSTSHQYQVSTSYQARYMLLEVGTICGRCGCHGWRYGWLASQTFTHTLLEIANILRSLCVRHTVCSYIIGFQPEWTSTKSSESGVMTPHSEDDTVAFLPMNRPNRIEASPRQRSINSHDPIGPKTPPPQCAESRISDEIRLSTFAPSVPNDFHSCLKSRL